MSAVTRVLLPGGGGCTAGMTGMTQAALETLLPGVVPHSGGGCFVVCHGSAGGILLNPAVCVLVLLLNHTLHFLNFPFNLQPQVASNPQKRISCTSA